MDVQSYAIAQKIAVLNLPFQPSIFRILTLRDLIMSGSPVLQRRLVLPDDESENTDPKVPNCEVDGISSLVALALDHHLPLLADGYTANASAITVRAGSGSFATVNISRLAMDISGRYQSWYGEESLFGLDRAAGQKVAIKHATHRDESTPSRALASIANEIRVLGHQTLRDHQNIVDVIGLSWTGTIYDDLKTNYRWPVLLLEYANCGTLEDFFSLEDLKYTWDINNGISYDIIQGLEALDDSGVFHGDLKLTNVLVFRTGSNAFTAKLCDFGSAMILVDLEKDVPVRQTVFTPPWDAPESSQNIMPDDLYKTDIYCYGLLLCRIFTQGGDPFRTKHRMTPELLESSELHLINKWKRDDEVHNVCKFAVRRPNHGQYTTQQLAALDQVIDMTVRTNISSRAEEHCQIKSVLRPDLASEDFEKR